MSEEHVFDLLPAYALGSLDEDELVLVAGHLARCPLCRGELAQYENAVDRLVLSVPLETPADRVKSNIMRRVENSTVNTPVRGSQQGQHPGKPKHTSFGALLRQLLAQPVGVAFAVVTVLILVFLAGSSFMLWQKVNSIQTQIPADAMKVVHMAGTEAAPQTRGYLMVFRNENYGTLVVEDAPGLEPGRQYQLWLVKDGKRTSGGVFSVNEQGYGTLQVVADRPLDTFGSFGVTVEPAGGSPGPTGKKVLGGSL